VVSNPTGINVTVGRTGSTPLAGNTSVTLRSRAVGARCGRWRVPAAPNAAKTCRSTMTANAAVTAKMR
jgi:hypothetical protein